MECSSLIVHTTCYLGFESSWGKTLLCLVLHEEGLVLDVAACETTHWVMGDRIESMLVGNSYGSAD